MGKRVLPCRVYTKKRGGSVLGKNVLELGAGAGLVGMVCKKLGAKKVVLSDHPNAIALLRKNVQRNFHSNQEPGTDTDTTDDISVLPLDWRDEQHLAAVLKNGPYDVVVATDVVFSTDLVRAFPNHHVPPLRLPILVLPKGRIYLCPLPRLFGSITGDCFLTPIPDIHVTRD